MWGKFVNNIFVERERKYFCVSCSSVFEISIIPLDKGKHIEKFGQVRTTSAILLAEGLSPMNNEAGVPSARAGTYWPKIIMVLTTALYCNKKIYSVNIFLLILFVILNGTCHG